MAIDFQSRLLHCSLKAQTKRAAHGVWSGSAVGIKKDSSEWNRQVKDKDID